MSNLQIGTASQDQQQPEAPAQQPAAARTPYVRENAGCQRFMNGELTQVGARQSVTAADIRGPANGSVLSSARTQGSGGRPSVIKGTDLVTVGGIAMHVKTAVQLGHLRVTESGGYADTKDTTPTEDNPSDNGDTIAEGDAADESATTEAFAQAGTEQVFNHLVQALPADTVDKIISAEIDQQAHDHAGAGLVEGVSVVRDAFVGQANQMLARAGVADGQDFHAWAKQHEPEVLKAAINKHVYERSPTAYAELAEKYLRANPPSIESIRAAGIPVRQIGGQTLITIRGTEVTPEIAAKLGWI